MHLRGVDVSEHQGSIDVPRLKRAGVNFVICKFTEGQDYVDSTWGSKADSNSDKLVRLRKRVAELRKSDMPFGAYHFLRPRPGRTGAVEAQWAISVARSVGWGKPGDGILWADVERTELGRRATIRYIKEFRAECERQGVKVGLYTFPHFWITLLGNPGNLGFEHLWIAHPGVARPTMPAGWPDWTIWQDSFKGNIGGENPVDTNRAHSFPRLAQRPTVPKSKPTTRRQRIQARMRRARRTYLRTKANQALRVYLISKARLGFWDDRYCMYYGVPTDVNERVRRFITRGYAAGLVPTSTVRRPRFLGDNSHHIRHNAADMGLRREHMGTKRRERFQHSEWKRRKHTKPEELIGPTNFQCVLRGRDVRLAEGTALENQHDDHVHGAFV